MNNLKDQNPSVVLDDATLSLLGDSLAPESMAPDRRNILFSNIIDRIERKESALRRDFFTLRANEGEWIKIAPKIEKKSLFVDPERNIESYLLRVEPGAEAPGHRHAQDEYCLVLQGDVQFDDLELQAGDFHFAHRGSWHGVARSKGGALLYLEGAIS